MKNLSLPEFKYILEKHVRKLPFWMPSHRIVAAHLKGSVYAGYRTTDARVPFGTTFFDLNVGHENSPATCYILSLEVAEHQRRQGRGKAMVKCIEDFCKDYGCNAIEVTTSEEISPKLYVAMGFERSKSDSAVFRKAVTLK